MVHEQQKIAYSQEWWWWLCGMSGDYPRAGGQQDSEGIQSPDSGTRLPRVQS